VIFAFAFVLDTSTGNRWTAIWGSAAILSTSVVAFPAVRPWMLAGVSYVTVWTGFNVARAYMDDVPWATARLHLASDTERILAGGNSQPYGSRMPSTVPKIPPGMMSSPR